MSKKIATPMELNAIFASGAMSRARASHAIMCKYLPLKNGHIVWSACGNPNERETIAEAGYRQSSQTLAQWATTFAILNAMPKNLKPSTSLQADLLAEYVFTLVTLRGSIAKRMELVELLPNDPNYLELSSGNASETNVKLKRAKLSARANVNAKRPPKAAAKNSSNSVDSALEILDTALQTNSISAAQFKRLVSITKLIAQQFAK